MKIPLYQKIENDIKEQIDQKKLKAGEIIPSENQLSNMYDVSRMTVRQALNNLVLEGYLYKHKGKGTFVSERKIEKSIHGVRGFTEEMNESGRVVKNEVTVFEKIVPTDNIAEKLFLDNNQEIYYIERVRYGNDIPVLYEVLYVPVHLFKDLTKEDMNHSFYNFVETKTPYKITHCFQTIEAKPSNKLIEERLKIDKKSPVLSITRNTFLSNGRPFEYVISTYRSDQYKFVQYAFKD